MRKSKEGFNFHEMVSFEMPVRMVSGVKIKVKENGEVYFSSAIVESIRKRSEKMWVDFRHSEDYKTLAIKPDGEKTFRMPKAGTMKFGEWKELLKKYGYSIPAIYLFEWQDEEGLWIGRLQEVAKAPVI